MQKIIAIVSAILLSAVMFVTSIASVSAMPTAPLQSTQLATFAPVLLADTPVKRAVVLTGDDFSTDSPTLDPSRLNRKKKKQAVMLKPFEKNVWSMAKNLDAATTEYFDRHDRSNAKKKNGWIQDYPKNVDRAMMKLHGSSLSGIPGIKLPKLF